jgi:hypothetical protein
MTPPKWVLALGYRVASQVSRGGLGALLLTEAMLQLLG